jgi:uncharacterized small protein (DUF1192 family)
MLNRRSVLAACSSVVLCGLALADTTVQVPSTGTTIRIEVVRPDVPTGDVVDVQVALLLDTSNSMDGLINQARTQLWKIVNEIGKTKRDGKTPRLQVALYEYGNNNLSAGEGYVRMVTAFTTDLDKVSEMLWSLRTNGGSEYCGKVIDDAAAGLSWSADPKVYKAIFIAGNEPFTQGDVPYAKAIGKAVGRGVVVNTIHCGDRSAGEQGMWADGARLGEGKFLTIDQDRVAVQIQTPHDEIIIRLSSELNSTYVPYGAAGEEGQARQLAQDATVASAAPSAAADRAAAKAGANYRNAGWDLVDAIEQKAVEVKDVDREKLPEGYRKLSDEELAAKVAELSKQRAKLQAEIQKLNAEREKFIAANQPTTQPGEATLDSATVQIVREQMEKKGFDGK